LMSTWSCSSYLMGNHLAELMNIGGHIVVRWRSLPIPAERSADGAPIVI
jgi:hypothetical protein